MSFTGDIKNEIGRQLPTAGHCRKAMLAALLSFCATVEIHEDDAMVLTFSTEREIVCKTYLQLLRKILRTESDKVVVAERLRTRTSVYEVRVEEDLAAEVLRSVGILNRKGQFADEVPILELAILQRECCRRAYLQGAFLAAGTCNDPTRSYHLEIVCREKERAEQISLLMQAMGIDKVSVATRGRYAPVYLKDGSQIADLLSMLSSPVAMMAFENARIVREVRGNVNRKVNFEAANIKKAASAATEQLMDIRLIEELVGLSELPPVLDETARLRLQYPTATLQELGDLADPPVGKSGINHRLRKISAFAAQLREEQGGKESHGE